MSFLLFMFIWVGLFDMDFVFDFIMCFLATFCFCFIMNAPKKSMATASFFAAVGFLVYDLVKLTGIGEPVSIFVGTACIAVSGEVCARVFKMPSTVFVFPGVVAFVPGVGIYRTMLALIQSDFEKFQKIGTETIIIALAMAMAIAVINVFSRHVFPKKKG